MNIEYLTEQLTLIDTYSRRARSIAVQGSAAFLSNPILVDAAIREIVVLFESSHNIAKHIISESDWRAAQSKADAFQVLAEQGVIPAGLCEALCNASRFRNLATYQTARIDDERVFEILSDHLADFETFATTIAAWLQQRETA